MSTNILSDASSTTCASWSTSKCWGLTKWSSIISRASTSETTTRNRVTCSSIFTGVWSTWICYFIIYLSFGSLIWKLKYYFLGKLDQWIHHYMYMWKFLQLQQCNFLHSNMGLDYMDLGLLFLIVKFNWLIFISFL